MSNEREGDTRVLPRKPRSLLRPFYLQAPATRTTVERIGPISL